MGSNRARNVYRRDEHEEMVAGPPMDLSFKKASTIDGYTRTLTHLSEIIIRELGNERARSIRVGKVPPRTASNRFLTSSLWLSNNSLTSIARLDNLVNKLLDDPSSLAWLDLSFNNIGDIDEDITKFPNLKIVYFHGNNITSLNTIIKMRKLRKLRNLTLHGNPIESIPSYRGFVLNTLPQLVNLDFAPVIAADRQKAPPAGYTKIMQM